MKIFEGSKVNFVDRNNIFVGYNLNQDCCEYADWFISEREENRIYDEHFKRIKREIPEVKDYIFDKTYFEEVNSKDLDAGGMVRFRLISKEKPDLFLHLFNCQNGYYGHGFEAKIGDENWKEGTL